MPASDLSLVHTFEGGLATDFGSVADLDAGGSRRIRIPFLTRAENIFYESYGAIKKMGGATKYNASTIEGGEEIRGVFEYIRQGTAGSATRTKIVVAGTKYLADGNDGTFASFVTGRQDDSVPNFNVFEDQLIIATDNPADDVQTWDQTSAAALGGTSERFSFSVTHVNRLWAAGDFAVPSRLYYSDVLDAADFAGGSVFDVDPDDGDIITGIFPFRGTLLVFKGPNFGSIHVISGATPATFERTVLVRGIGAIWQNLIFPLPNDVGFVSLDGTIRSIGATQKFGDFELGALSRPINTWLQNNLAIRHARKGWAATDFIQGYTLFTLPTGSDTIPKTTLLMDYRGETARFALWPALQAWSVARMSDPANSDRPILFLGGNDGFVRKTQQATQGVDGTTPITCHAKTPILQYGVANRLKTVSHLGLGLKLTGVATVDVTIGKDDGTSQVISVEAGAGAVLGAFVLGTDTLAGQAYITKWTDVLGSGQFREITYDLSNDALAENVTIEALHVVLEQSANPSYE